MKKIEDQKKVAEAPRAVFPCVLRNVQVFNKRSPLVIGVDVIDGQLRLNTPVCVVAEDKTVVGLGRVTSIEHNHKQKAVVKKGEPSVAIKIDVAPHETAKVCGRHFLETDVLHSQITRSSIDVLKSVFRADVSKEEWMLVVKMKKLMGIQ